ncbi:lysylphosphatidylglycerol synthase transmembrane domain-containing protein [Peribacillus tepidiphilus]|uniref:lysylphosphatidylglycerol synthase transmembrane domain-containing protein n=1 Tax=Peribacillus tepidiphilus TaxID=2652445 RepID=UPI0035B52910
MKFKSVKWIGSGLIVAVCITILFLYFDASQLKTSLFDLLFHPYYVIILFFCYFLSFLLKAEAWRILYEKRVKLRSCMLGLFYSLFINHISPIKAGDLVRAIVLEKEEKIPFDLSLHSVILLRIIDTICLAFIALTGILILGLQFQVPIGIILVFGLIGGAVLFYVSKQFPSFFKKHIDFLKKITVAHLVTIISLTLLSWVLEAAVIWSVIKATGEHIDWFTAIWVNSVTIISQVFQIAPGGLATYEATMSIALSSIGFELKLGLHLALVSHFMKFIFSYITGIYALVVHPIDWDWIKNRIKRGGNSL